MVHLKKDEKILSVLTFDVVKINNFYIRTQQMCCYNFYPAVGPAVVLA